MLVKLKQLTLSSNKIRLVTHNLFNSKYIHNAELGFSGNILTNA